MGSLTTLLIALALIALAFWLFNSYFPVPQPGKTIINAVLVIVVIVWLLRWAGISLP